MKNIMKMVESVKRILEMMRKVSQFKKIAEVLDKILKLLKIEKVLKVSSPFLLVADYIVGRVVDKIF